MTGRTVSKQIGALWKHTAKQGNTGVFLRGTLDQGALGDVPIAVFKNTRKNKENEPDYRIVLSGMKPATENAKEAEAQTSESAEL